MKIGTLANEQQEMLDFIEDAGKDAEANTSKGFVILLIVSTPDLLTWNVSALHTRRAVIHGLYEDLDQVRR
jgi:hypothetical protein